MASRRNNRPARGILGGMNTLETSRLFSRWRNPETGVESLILTQRLAPVQKSFYFTSPGFTNDGKYLWVSCAFPPDGGKRAVPVLGLVDFERDEFRIYHETQFATGSPLIDSATGEAYWCNHLDVWKRGPRPEDRPVRVCTFPKSIAGKRTPERLASHLTYSANRKSINLDVHFADSNEAFICDMSLADGSVQVWQKLDGFYNHAQFSPTDPDVQMFAHEYWKDHAAEPFDGLLPYHRMWMIRRGGKAEPILKAPVSHSGHEWWDAAGTHIWYVHYGVGIKKVNLATRQETILWPGHLSHGQSDRTGKYLVADLMADPVISDCHVRFRNLTTGREIDIVNRPPLPDNATQITHLHPHPHFCLNDQYICYTTTIHGRVDLALVRTDGLVQVTS